MYRLSLPRLLWKWKADEIISFEFKVWTDAASKHFSWARLIFSGSIHSAWMWLHNWTTSAAAAAAGVCGVVTIPSGYWTCSYRPGPARVISVWFNYISALTAGEKKKMQPRPDVFLLWCRAANSMLWCKMYYMGWKGGGLSVRIWLEYHSYNL